MEVHHRMNSPLAKRMWSVLRVTLFMIRKGLISKRKLIMDMNLMMKRGKLLRNPFTDHRTTAPAGPYGLQEYEFSCSNSPNPVSFHLPKRKHHYFPCINLPEVIEEVEENASNVAALAMVPKTPEYNFNLFQNNLDYASVFGPGEKRSALPSPLSVRVSNYSSEDGIDSGTSGQVDDEAEEFIRRFYEQLRLQSRMQLLQYPDSN